MIWPPILLCYLTIGGYLLAGHLIEMWPMPRALSWLLFALAPIVVAIAAVLFIAGGFFSLFAALWHAFQLNRGDLD